MAPSCIEAIGPRLHHGGDGAMRFLPQRLSRALAATATLAMAGGLAAVAAGPDASAATGAGQEYSRGLARGQLI
jgi:hypothetical protein